MRIGVLTSSRADFGIYLPLLKRLAGDPFFNIQIIAFGTHLSPFHGHTIDQILDEGFDVPFQIESLVLGDSEEAISSAMALTSMKFSSFWNSYRNRFDIVFCLGDRYEMHAAVMAGIPFGIKFSHFHGGETTLGAIDNIFRHSISLASEKHFVSAEEYAKRIEQIIGSRDSIYLVGALSLDNLNTMKLLSRAEFYEKWKIDLSKPTVLVTLHPETTAVGKNQEFARTLAAVINQFTSFQFVVTMPNSDTQGATIRSIWQSQLSSNSHVFLIENFGTRGYFSCMKYCLMLLGNTSSGIIEAASFSRYVINLGDRQKGRARGANVFDCSFDEVHIINLVNKIKDLPEYSGDNIYWSGGAVDRVVKILRETKNE